MADYVNTAPWCVHCQESTKQDNNRFPRWLLLSFGLLCILQASLNVSLRLFHYEVRAQCDFNETWLHGENTHRGCGGAGAYPSRHRARGGVPPGKESMCCPHGWVHFLERCFLVEATNRNWTEAESCCGVKGANLASIHSSTEHVFIQKLILDQLHSLPSTWIGGQDIIKEGKWLWSDGSKFDYFIWEKGQPDNFKEREHCLVMNWGEEKRWNDLTCATPKPFVCSKKI